MDRLRQLLLHHHRQLTAKYFSHAAKRPGTWRSPTSTGGTPVPRGMRRLFVGCVTRPELHHHRAQNYSPRNTPKPRPLTSYQPLVCSRDRFYHATVQRPRPGSHTLRVCTSTRTGGTPVPRGMRRLFVGCVTRPELHHHRAQNYPPRNTPKPRPLTSYRPLVCSRGRFYHATVQRPRPSSHNLRVCTSTRTGGTPVPRGMRRLFVGCVTRPELHHHRAQNYSPRNTPKPRPRTSYQPLVCSRGRFYHTTGQRPRPNSHTLRVCTSTSTGGTPVPREKRSSSTSQFQDFAS